VKASPMMTRYETEDPKKKRSDDQSISEAIPSATCEQRPMYECSRVVRQARSRSSRLAWLSANTPSSITVPISQPHRANASGSASRPGPVVPFSRLSVVPTREKRVVSGTS